MGAVLINAISLFAIIFFGFLLKRMNILSKADGLTVSVIILNITLPAALITNLSTLKIETALISLIVVGFLLNSLMIFIGYFLKRKDSQVASKFLMYSVSGYNIGNFAIPFTQSFLPAAIPLLAMFDMGNSIMLAGGTAILIERLNGEGDGFSPLKILKRLFSSVPFTTYFIMLIIRLMDVTLPEIVLSTTSIMGSANTFLSMFMIGLYLDLRLPREFQGIVGKVFAVRYGFGILIALIIYLLPLPDLLTTVLCLLSVGPISTFGVINSVKAGMREEAVGFASSLSFITSFILMTIVIMWLA